MKTRKSDFALVKEAEREGRVVSTSRVVEPKRTALNEALNTYFRGRYPEYDGMFGEDVAEDIIYELNQYVEREGLDKHEIGFSVSGGSNIYLLPITPELDLKVMTVEDYYGDGDYAQYVDLSRFVITDVTTEQDVDQLIEVLKTVTSF